MAMETLLVAPAFAMNGYGEVVGGTEVAYQCRAFRKKKILYGNTSREFVTNAQVYIDPSGADIPLSSKCRISGDPETYTVTQIDVQRDETGAIHHVKIYLT